MLMSTSAIEPLSRHTEIGFAKFRLHLGRVGYFPEWVRLKPVSLAAAITGVEHSFFIRSLLEVCLPASSLIREIQP